MYKIYFKNSEGIIYTKLINTNNLAKAFHIARDIANTENAKIILIDRLYELEYKDTSKIFKENNNKLLKVIGDDQDVIQDMA